LVAHLHFLPTHKAKQKNAKELPSPRTTTRQTMTETTTTDRRAACNTGLAKVAVQCSADTFVVNQNLFSASTFVVKIATFAKPENVGGNCIRTNLTYVYSWDKEE
jgi:hypothetical protein